MKICRILIVAITAMTIAVTVFAQVSLSISIVGKITKVEITSSSVNLYVDAMLSDSDKSESWAIETGSLNELSAKGIRRTDLKVGRLVQARGTLGTGNNRIIAPVSGISFPQ